MSWSENDSKNLERIADALEKLILIQEQPLGMNLGTLENNFALSPNSLEAEFFHQVTMVYYEEEKLVQERGGGKKSSVRVGNELSKFYSDFFTQQLQGIKIDVAKSGLLVFKREDQPLCAVKVYTDLGYGSRGERWYDGIDYFVDLAKKHGVPADRVLFMVISFRNGLDNEHVTTLLGFDISNKDILERQNRNHLENYAYKYVDQANGHLPSPHDQVYFLAGKLHPNVLEEALHEDLNAYEWFRPSVTELIEHIKSF